MNKIEIAAGIIIILIVIGASIYLSKPSKVSYVTNVTPISAKTSVLTFQLTDPPEVPNGTQALVIYYSSLNAHLLYPNGTSGWASAEGSGSINLLSLVNMTQVIGKANIPSNATVDMVRFNITKATITIDNNTYNVTVPSEQVTVHVTNAAKVNGTSSAVIDITPTIATIYTNTSTIFVLVPSLRAVVVSGSASATIGAKVPVNASMRHELDLARPNITISQIVLSQKNNSTYFSVKVSNNGNESIRIMHVMLFGNESVNINASSYGRIEIEKNIIYIKRFGNSTEDMQIPQGISGSSLGSVAGSLGVDNISAGASVNSTLASSAGISKAFGQNFTLGKIRKYVGKGMLENISEQLGISLNSTILNETNFTQVLRKMHNFNISEGELHRFLSNESNPAFNAIINNFGLNKEEDIINVSLNAEHFGVINFLVSQNGTLVLPFQGIINPSALPANLEEFNESYTLGAHSSIVLAYSGPISFARDHVTISVIPGESYKVVVVGNEGAHASANITAS
ncbi:MAG: DUF4382 domain-containing protein [Candidatus Micrarchaeia archaeon]